MIMPLILLILLAIAGKIFLGMALEVAGAILGLVIVFIAYLVRRRRRQ
jgi:hypothetical protein